MFEPSGVGPVSPSGTFPTNTKIFANGPFARGFSNWGIRDLKLLQATKTANPAKTANIFVRFPIFILL